MDESELYKSLGALTRDRSAWEEKAPHEGHGAGQAMTNGAVTTRATAPFVNKYRPEP